MLQQVVITSTTNALAITSANKKYITGNNINLSGFNIYHNGLAIASANKRKYNRQ